MRCLLLVCSLVVCGSLSYVDCPCWSLLWCLLYVGCCLWDVACRLVSCVGKCLLLVGERCVSVFAVRCLLIAVG